MNWASLSDFLAMGGYAGYVWGSFGVVAAALGLEFILVRQRRAAVVRRLRRQVLAERPQQEAT